jgi:hypothetical protein
MIISDETKTVDKLNYQVIPSKVLRKNGGIPELLRMTENQFSVLLLIVYLLIHSHTSIRCLN